MNSNVEAVAFLKAVLPKHGWYAAWTRIDKEHSYNRFFATVEELADHIAAEDFLGRAVYHACSTFNEPTRRTQANVWGARALWLDVDSFNGKNDSPYASSVDAVEAVLSFCSAAQLPAPALCRSGGGVHAYWPLNDSLCGSDWLELATGLRGACQRFGLHIDPVRTTDLASVLRTPGTHNRKLPTARSVECHELTGPYDVGVLEHLADYAGAGVQRSSVAVGGSAVVGSALTEALIVKPDYAPVYADVVADNCAQLQWMRESRGCTPEPHWYACLGVLSRCADGLEKAQEWSSGHPDYDPAETAAKLERTLSLTGATTCGKFEAVNAAGCQACPLRGTIVSPISIVQRSEKNTGVPESNSEWVHQSGQADPDILPDLPKDFAWSDASELLATSEKANGDENEVLVSRYPIYLAGVGVGEVRNASFAFKFRQWLPNRGWFEIAAEAGKFVGPGGHAHMAERGATIHDFKIFTAYVRAACDLYHASEQLKMHFDQCGWKEGQDKFLVGDCLYDKDGVEEHVTCAPELSTRSQWLGPQSGTLNDWSAAANTLFTKDCEAQSFAAIASFAAPLMKLQAEDEGGAVVNLMSRGSGSGKTTALTAVYSAWGREQGLSLTNSDTRVAKSITLGVLGNLPVIYDEIGNRDPMVVRDFIMMFTNGRDKMRGAQDGTINHTKASWQTLLLSSSNLSLYDMLSNLGGTDAPAFRVLEFPCELPKSVVPAKGDKLRKALQANAGWAGDAYVDYLVQPGVMPWVRQALEQWTMELWDKVGGKPEHRFWMRTIGAVAVASKIVNDLDILNFQPSRIVDWALNHVSGYRNDQQGVTGHEERGSIEMLGLFIAENVDAILVVQKPFKAGDRTTQVPLTRPQRHIYMRYELEGHRLLLAEKVFQDWLRKREISGRHLLRDLENIKVVISRRRYATLQAGTGIPGAQMACIEISGAHPALSGIVSSVTAPLEIPELLMA